MKSRTLLIMFLAIVVPVFLLAEKNTDKIDMALFCPDPEAFIQKLLGNDSLILRVTPYSSGPKTAVFNIAGLKAEAEPYNTDLGWF